MVSRSSLIKKDICVDLWRKLLAVAIVAVGIMGMLAVTQFVLRGSLF